MAEALVRVERQGGLRPSINVVDNISNAVAGPNTLGSAPRL
jgi:hypothetical protein